MRRRIGFFAAVMLCVMAILAGCGTKDANSVVKDLDKVVNNMESYHGKGTMILHTGQQPLEYQVDVSYQKPQYYRIELTNAKKDITQIVLRNDDGVFVLTPRLNKVFRFQSDWPANQGQVYLYQTLVSSILLDNSRQFTVDKDAYVFDVMANYQNGSLARQKIWLNKSDYAPSKVEVSDTNAAVMVEVKFDSFEFGSKLDKSVFDTQRNMSGKTSDQPTMGEPDNGSATNDNGSENAAAQTDNGSNDTGQNNASNGTDNSVNADSGNANQPSDDVNADSNDANQPSDDANANSDNGNQPSDDANADSNNGNQPSDDANADSGNANQSDENASAEPDANNNGTEVGDAGSGGAAAGGSSFVIMEPSYLPDGVSEKDQQDIVYGGNPGYMIRYTGDYDYTLIETQPHDQAVSLTKGDMIDLGFTLGQISGDDQRTLTWTYDGIEYRLTSATLPEPEMVTVAQSVQGEMGK